MTSTEHAGDLLALRSVPTCVPVVDRLLDGLPAAVVAVDVYGRVEHWNSAAERLFGWSRDEAAGRTVYELLVPEESAAAARTWVRDVITVGSHERTWTLLDRSGRPLAVPVTGRRLVGPDGVVLGMYAVVGPSAAGAGSDRAQLQDVRRTLQQQQVLFQALVERASDVAVVNGADGSILWCSPACDEIFGFPATEVLGGNGYDYVHPDDEDAVRATFGAVVAEPGAAATATYRHRHADGRWRWVEATLRNRLADPDIRGVVLNLRDVTVQVEAERALRSSEERYRAIAQSAQEGIWVADALGHTLHVNPKLTELLGRTAEEVSGRPVLELLGPGQSPLVALRLRDRERRGAEEYDLEYQHPDGRQRWFRIGSSPLRDPDGSYVGSLAMVSDVTEVRRAEAALRRLALFDALTELPNRTLLADRLAQAAERCARTGTPLSVLFVDIDQFRVVNDALGHRAGDQLLAAVAGRLVAAARPGDTVSRFGGDEFVVLAEDAGPAEAENVAALLQAALQEPFEVEGRSLVVSVSIGVATSPDSPADALLQHADAAMHVAKSRGRRRSAVFDLDTATGLRDHLDLAGDLRRALREDTLDLHYQPVIDLGSGALLGLEALARWTHPTRGAVSPQLFVSVAEQTGLAIELDRWVLGRACSDVARLRRAGVLPPSAYVAVNVSAGHVCDGDLVSAVLTAARAAGLPTSALTVELTESAAMADVDQARATFQRLRDAGVAIAIDDFGTGYSCLAYLTVLPVDRVKIDRMFVDSITSSPDDLAVVASVVELSRAVGATVIAEGVETRQQLGLLQRLGCQAGQGWLWSRAVPPDALPALMAAHRERGFDVGARPAGDAGGDAAVGVEHGLHRLLQLRAEHASARTIAAALNAEGYRTPRGTRWHPASVTAVVPPSD